MREENRRLAASESLLAPKGGAAGAAGRPQSGNKKFLQKYNLDKMNLFAP